MQDSWKQFLDRPEEVGPFGAVMDEYARAAVDFCSALEEVSPERFTATIASPDPDCVSIRALSMHVLRAACGYADYIRERRGLAKTSPFSTPPLEITRPSDVRPLLAEAMRYTEGALDGLYSADEDRFTMLIFRVRWGAIYDPEMMLEHAVLHLLRHRRQIRRWPV